MPASRPTDQKCGAKITGSKGNKPPGSPCRNPAGDGTSHLGFGFCALHSGATPNGVKDAEKKEAAWRERLEKEIDPSLNTVAGLRDDTAVEPRTRLGAAKDLLDRAGVRVNPEDGLGTLHIIVSMDDD